MWIIRGSLSISCSDFLVSLLEFNLDGIKDRQLEYERTIEFVDTRSKILAAELQKIELKKQRFKKDNAITEIRSDASVNIQQQLNYDENLFKLKSQNDLVLLLKQYPILFKLIINSFSNL